MPRLVRDEVDALKRQITDLSKMLSSVESAILAKLHANFVAAGGCERCHGRGWTVVWDTMDCMDGSYAEYGPCPAGDACTAKLTGPDHGVPRSKYDNIRGVPGFSFEKDPAWIAAGKHLRDMILSLEQKLTTVRYRTDPLKGDLVVVVKGRKAPVGFIGEVFWCGRTKTGYDRIGIKDPKDPAHVEWTYPSNVERVFTENR